jgi:phosphoglycolate phosphatase-like HAD superfamily hydrolase
MRYKLTIRGLFVACFQFLASLSALAQDPLPSWNDGPAKSAIIAFVEQHVTYESDDEGYYVPPEERIAVFDNDGTLWCEQPMYFQVMFAFDRIRATTKEHPEWRDKEPFKSVIDGDMKKLAEQGEKGLLEVIAATHSGMTVAEFDKIVSDWMNTAHHPRFKQPYNKCIYQPMVEVLAYLRNNGFKTFIVSGGGVDFMRPWAPAAYGIPPEQIVGSCGKLKFEVRAGEPVLMKLPEVDFIDDKAGKPVGISRFIGRRPIMAFGNSDGDFEMLQYTTSEPKEWYPRLGLLVHHTDAQREYAYDNPSNVGQLERGLEAAKAQGWVLIDMKNDWKKVFAFE